MSPVPLDVPGLLAVVDDPRTLVDLRTYFQPADDPGESPLFPGSRFEGFAGGGDHPRVANTITAEDLIAVTLLAVDVPGTIALQLLEGQLGKQVGALLAAIPTDVALHESGAAELTAPPSAARQVWNLLELQPGMGWVTASKVLARKRPHLIPVYDSTVRCAVGKPLGPWSWLRHRLTADDSQLIEHLQEVRDTARLPASISLLRVLDVILWMRHHPHHHRTRCAGLALTPTNPATNGLLLHVALTAEAAAVAHGDLGATGVVRVVRPG